MSDLPVPVHPLASIWPLMSDSELDCLAADIKEHGQRLPIIRVEGLILDGRNRWLACQIAGVEPWCEDIEPVDNAGLDALAWSLNEHRRHAPNGTRAMAAARRANMRQGARTDLASNEARLSQTDAAIQFGVSRTAVQRAKTVLDHGDARLIEMVESGDEAVSLAAKTVRRLKETGRQITSVAELKDLMRSIYREENPLPEPAPRPREEPTPPSDHIGVDTFGVVRAVVRHAEQYSPSDAAARIDKWTKLNIRDDLPPAIAYLTALQECLGGKT
jgi:ParB-like chromosome segregation protein Spo0J